MIVETVNEEYTKRILILGPQFPELIRAFEKYIKEYGGTVFTSLPDEDVDYIVVFDDEKLLGAAVKKLAPGGKVLHVVSHSKSHPSSQIPVYYLAPKQTFKAQDLIRTILTKLYALQPYSSPKSSRSHKKSSPNPKQQRSVPWSKLARIAMWGIVGMSLPLVIEAIAIGITLLHLNTVTSAFEDRSRAQESLEKARTSFSVARMIHRVNDPIITIVHPETAFIVSTHLEIVDHGITTTQSLIEQYPVFSTALDTLKDSKENQIHDDMKHVQHALSVLDTHSKPLVTHINALYPYKDTTLVKPVWQTYERIQTSQALLAKAQTIAPHIPEMLAVTTRKQYLVLLQNNFELRPTGGFIGSYALITVENGTVKDFSIEDVYEADGQLKGFVEPPSPLKNYLNQPQWFLRDSNWNPDFALSAQQAEWFLEKELDITVDGVIAIDLFVLQHILQALNGVYVPDYQATVYGDDFFYKLQQDNHAEFFPGSNKKRNLISSLSNALLIALSSQDNLSMMRVAQAIDTSLSEKHIQLFSHSQTTQDTIEQLQWGGRVVSHAILGADSRTIADYLMVIDANVGVNKVNYAVEREFFSTLSDDDEYVVHDVIVYYRNTSEPDSESAYAGVYQNYVRFLLPAESMVTSLSIDDEKTNLLNAADITSLNDKKTIGYFFTVNPQQDRKVYLAYKLPKPAGDFTYQLMVQKQAGTHDEPFVLKLSDILRNRASHTSISAFPYLTTLDQDTLISIDFAE